MRKSILLSVLVFALCFSLVGCGNGIKKDSAKEVAESFLFSVENGDFETAKNYLHPERPFDVEKYFKEVEDRASVDFQNGIEIRRYTGYSSSLYDSEVGGSEYELEMNIIVDGIAFELTVEIVRNVFGFGIYEIDLDK